MTSRRKVIALVGPTASGKTALARVLAERRGGELISIDSRQLYIGLDLGTGKEGILRLNRTGSELTKRYPWLRYLDKTPQWLTDMIKPMTNYSAAAFQTAAYQVMADIESRGKQPIMVGGSTLYTTAITEGYQFNQNPARNRGNARHAAKPGTKSPPQWDIQLFGLDLPRDTLYERIDSRVDERISRGMIGEAEALINSGVSAVWLRGLGLEYRYLVDLIEGRLDEFTFRQQLKLAIHAYARRQLAWWRHHGAVQWVTSVDEIS